MTKKRNYSGGVNKKPRKNPPRRAADQASTTVSMSKGDLDLFRAAAARKERKALAIKGL